MFNLIQMMRVAGLALLLAMTACVHVEPPSEPVETAEQRQQAEALAQQKAQQKAQQLRRQHLRELLSKAQRALAKDRLMIPASDNAHRWYQQVLGLDGSNAEAHWGMKQITQRYLQLAEQAFASGRDSKAEQMLAGAAKGAATQAQLEEIRQRYRRQAAANELYLPIAELSARSDVVLKMLRGMARLAHTQESRLLIVARSDTEGRWIYQQMRESVQGYRLRGNIEVGRVPRIALIDL